MFIRYNEAAKWWEYDTSGGSGVGPWVILPVDYSQIYNPPIITPPTPIPPNIAFTDVHNIFTIIQTMNCVNPAWYLQNTAGGANSKVFRIVTTPDTFFVQSMDDALTVVQGQYTIDRTGNARASGFIRSDVAFYERLRATPMGYWQNIPFNATNFGAGASATWAVGPTAVVQNRFTIIGLTMIWNMYISWFSGSNLLTGTTAGVTIAIPGGFSTPGNTILQTAYAVDGGRVELDAGPTGPNMGFNKRDGSNFTNGGAIGIIGTFTFEIVGAGVNVDV